MFRYRAPLHSDGTSRVPYSYARSDNILGLHSQNSPVKDESGPFDDPACLLTQAIKIAEAEAMDAAISAAIPRVSIMKVHAGRIAATRQVGEGGQILTVGAIDR